MNVRFSRLMSRFQVLAVLTIILCFTASGCAPVLNMAFKKSLPPLEGEQIVPGLKDKVTVKRDNLGVPMIEATNMDDLIFAEGYVSAYDRFTQMEGFRLVGKGRLSELLGPATLEMDIYLRALNIKQVAESIYSSASPDLRHKLEVYSNGVNAYLNSVPTPMTLKMAGHKPEPWKPIDSAYVFVVLTLGLGQNLHEEIDILNVAQKVEVDKLAWLFPIYPDEPLPFEEMKKLKGLDLSSSKQDLEHLAKVVSEVNKLLVPETAASNNWVVSGKITKSGKPIFANDTHLPLTLPSIWLLMHLKSPEIQGAGVALAGAPGIISGYNGHTAAGMTMVMADNQDLFLEMLQERPDGLYYAYQGKWIKADSRQETFKVKGQSHDVIKTFYETRHGVLLNNVLTDKPRHELVPQPVKPSMGVALSWAVRETDHTMDTFFKVMLAKNVDEIIAATSAETSIIPLNMVMADDKDIAWQVTGRYPLRKSGRGLCPSPGWTGNYDWQGFLDPKLHPAAKNPAKGYIGTANHRTIPIDFPYIISSSWYYPDRAERIDEMMAGVKDYTVENCKAMQLDIKSRFVDVLKAALDEKTVLDMRSVWANSPKKQSAEKALEILKNFDGYMKTDSAGAAVVGSFMMALPKNLYADELGGVESQAYNSLLEAFLLKYSSLHDHMTERGRQSPFWDDVTTPEKETRNQILGKTMLDAVDILEKYCGADSATWQWGKMHTYHWKTDATMFSDYMGFVEKTGVKFLSGYFDRGPFPAPGDHTTLNVTGHHLGKDFDTWLIPEMRFIADFGIDEPLIGINSSGQSDNPASPHYDDGITAFLNGKYQPFPFKPENIQKHYTKVLTLNPGK